MFENGLDFSPSGAPRFPRALGLDLMPALKEGPFNVRRWLSSLMFHYFLGVNTRDLSSRDFSHFVLNVVPSLTTFAFRGFRS